MGMSSDYESEGYSGNEFGTIIKDLFIDKGLGIVWSDGSGPNVLDWTDCKAFDPDWDNFGSVDWNFCEACPKDSFIIVYSEVILLFWIDLFLFRDYFSFSAFKLFSLIPFLSL